MKDSHHFVKLSGHDIHGVYVILSEYESYMLCHIITLDYTLQQVNDQHVKIIGNNNTSVWCN
jgi:hypothetical protein